ncbi:pilus assembly protein PilS [Candidatus Pelagibacter giovannonii]|uniref:Pilus assembly protein PilS n=1 Tax=Candidatus Pelagibacter giovannonii TaxID=2563896 RepID=A0A6H1Q4A5_9PROT|nr:pilus assembly protein PilM [Candidatus Pelagibacter giovannonii]QIZ21330.1 pilus assembly protein PilS [Candidatus Pelagibacter giovannonii]
MNDQEDDKKNLDNTLSDNDNNNQSEVDSNNQPQSEENQNQNNETESDNKNQSIVDSSNQTVNENKYENQQTDLNEEVNEQKVEEKIIVESLDEIKNENNKSSHQVIHKKEGRLHIYVRQDKYKGELKSKNWVGRLYIDGKQKISSSGTTNLDEAIQILEKWFDDVQDESERLKNENNITKNNNQEATDTLTNNQINNQAQEQTTTTSLNENLQTTTQEQIKNKLSNIFGKIKEIKIKKPDFAKNLNKSSFNKSKVANYKSKLENFFKSKLGKSSVQGEEIIGVELSNKEIRIAQVSSNKANQWVLEKLHIHPVDITDDSTPIDNADKFSEELMLAVQKYKITSPNAAIAIPVTSAIIRVVTAPLMKDEELNKAIETNSLWENLVQLTDSLEDYSIFHQVINRNEKENTMDLLFVASKLTDINSYTSIIKNAGLNPVIIDVKCFALKSAVDQVNQIANKTEDTNLTAVLEFGLDENYLMILYDNNPIITDIFIRGQDRKILQDSQNTEEKEGLVRRYITQVKQAVQDFETKYEKRIRNIKVVSDIKNVDEYLASFRKALMNIGFNTFDPTEGLKIPSQNQQILDNKLNRSYLSTSVGLAFRKLDVFGYYKFVTAVKNINLLPDRSNVMKQKKMKAISGFAFKGITAAVAAIYVVLFGLSFWNIISYNNKLKQYEAVKIDHTKIIKQKKIVSKEFKVINTSLKLSKTLKSNKELTYRILAQVASSVPNRVKFDQVVFNGSNRLTIQGLAATDQDILKFIENLSKQKLVEQASLSSMRLPKSSAGSATMKGFRVFVKIKRSRI